jgi:hypothetical protein
MKRKSILIMIALIFALLFSGCGQHGRIISHNMTFTGGNDKWKAEYKITGQGEFYQNGDTLDYRSNDDKVFTLTFRGDLTELSSVKHFSYTYTSSASGGGASLDAPPDKNALVSHSSGNGAVESKDETISVVINIDGKQTSFDMKSK